ncbi:MAG TPA: pirin family protein [Terriglobia bacterium]|nr:pirin family protein [Terriglobia bacterium]
MITIRKSDERGRGDRGWLKSRFSFSFADYYDPAHMGFRALRVINDDVIAAGTGFGPHGHRDMEILTYVLEGRLLHRDSMGERHILGPNEVQAMTAGTGIVHSEYNASDDEPVHSIQIWIVPEAEDFQPSYQQFAFSPAEKSGRFRLLAGPTWAAANAQETMATIHQEAWLYVSSLDWGQMVRHQLASGRHAWAQVVRGRVTINGYALEEGDAAAFSDEFEVLASASDGEGGEFLLFDLA